MPSHQKFRRLPRAHMRRLLGTAMLAVLVAFALSNVARAQTQTIFNNGNIYGIENGARHETVFTLPAPATIAKVTTYHWNNATGAVPGTIGLMSDRTGDLYGPWQAIGAPGQGGVPNAYWVVAPNVTLPAGDYIVIDSDPATWAQNAASNGAGFVTVEASGQ